MSIIFALCIVYYRYASANLSLHVSRSMPNNDIAIVYFTCLCIWPWQLKTIFCSNGITENIYCLARMHNRELNRDQNLIGGQMAVQNWTEINAWTALVQRNLQVN